MSNGVSTMSEFRKAMSGRLHSIPTEGSLSHKSCSLALWTAHSRRSHLCLPWWYSHLHKDTVGALDNYSESAGMPLRVQLVPQAGEVWIWVNLDRISQSNHLGGNCRDGSCESVRSIRMAGTLEQKRSPVLCQIHKFLPMLHQGFLSPCAHPVQAH